MARLTESSELQKAACDYVHLGGWRVFPGAAWDGHCYHRGLPGARALELEHVRPVERATTNFRRVYHWWNIAPYAILAPTGEAFDVLTGPAEWAGAVPDAPVFVGPHGAGFLVTPGTPLHPELAALGAALLGDGGVVALPPTRLRAGPLTWLVTPVDTAWRPGDAAAVQGAVYGVAFRSSRSRPR